MDCIESFMDEDTQLNYLIKQLGPKITCSVLKIMQVVFKKAVLK